MQILLTSNDWESKKVLNYVDLNYNYNLTALSVTPQKLLKDTNGYIVTVTYNNIYYLKFGLQKRI